jgi:hypothetical protein
MGRVAEEGELELTPTEQNVDLDALMAEKRRKRQEILAKYSAFVPLSPCCDAALMRVRAGRRPCLLLWTNPLNGSN